MRRCNTFRGYQMYFNARPRMRANKAARPRAAAKHRFQLPPSHEGEREAEKVYRAFHLISTPALA